MTKWLPMLLAVLAAGALVAADEGRGYPRGGGGVPKTLNETTVTAVTVNGTTGNFTYANIGALDAGPILTTGIASNAASGSDALTVITEGARVRLGPDTYCAENGTTVLCTASGGVKSTIVTATTGLALGNNAGLQIGAEYADKATAPTVASCTSPTITWSNGTAAFQFDVGTSCTGISTAVITLPTVADGWMCECDNITAPTTREINASAWSTTTVTVTNYSRTLGTAADFTDGTDLRCMCRGG